MNSLTLTQNEAIAAGGLLGGILATAGIFALAVYILFIIAWWKLFAKTGEAGWKSLIPIYNIYIYCRIIGINFWIYALAIPFGLTLLPALLPSLATAFSFLALAYAIFLAIYEAIKLGNAFGKGTGFKIGLVIFPNIFLLILAFGNAKYHKPTTK